ncbi:MAG: hypothetical protein HY318_16780 [Armatimonadetes bacterium]|nr:hypothetical protein [Armatimonadota bacterium]
MSLEILLPLIAAGSCLEVALIFAILYVRVSRRKADLLFSLLSVCLGWMSWSVLMKAQALTGGEALFYLRMQYVGAFAATVVFVHFVWLAVREPVHFSAIVLTYALGIICAVMACTDYFLRLPAEDAHFLTGSATGPLFPFLAPLLIFGAAGGWVTLLRGVKLSRETAFAPLTANVHFVFLGGGILIIVGAMIVTMVLLLPRMHFPLNPLPVAVMLFCLFIASALGREVMRSESEKDRLKELVRFRDQAVRDVAHEIKNPLAAIHGTTATVLLGVQRGLNVESQLELLEMCVESCRRLMRLLNNMLDTARLEAGRDLELRLEETDLNVLVNSVLDLHRQVSSEHRLLFLSDLSMPTACVDADKLCQILSNLLSNAIKYSPEGGEVLVRLWDENQRISLAVTDPGIGMTPEQLDRLFRPFERMVDPDRKITGTGIGLHLVRKLVEAHGGSIAVDSEHGKGTTFTVALRRGATCET